MTPQETGPDLPMSVQESLVGAWVGGDLLRGRGTERSNASWDLSKESLHCLHCLHHSLASGQKEEREHGSAHQQKIRLKIY